MTAFERLQQITIAQAATLLGYSKRTIHRLLEEGELESVGSRKLRRIPLRSIDAYQQRHGNRNEDDDADSK